MDIENAGEEKSKVRNLLEGKENRIVQIGGDLFLLAFPAAAETADLLCYLLGEEGMALWPELIGKHGVKAQQECREKANQGKAPFDKSILKWVDEPFMVTHRRRSGELILVRCTALSAQAKTKGNFGKKETIAICPTPTELLPQNDDLPVWFRPCLIPLRKSGQSFDRNFELDNPDGTIIRGGGFYVYNELRQPGSWIFRMDPKSFRIDEVVNENLALEWIVWKGILYLQTNLCKVFPSEIMQVFGRL